MNWEYIVDTDNNEIVKKKSEPTNSVAKADSQPHVGKEGWSHHGE